MALPSRPLGHHACTLFIALGFHTGINSQWQIAYSLAHAGLLYLPRIDSSVWQLCSAPCLLNCKSYSPQLISFLGNCSFSHHFINKYRLRRWTSWFHIWAQLKLWNIRVISISSPPNPSAPCPGFTRPTQGKEWVCTEHVQVSLIDTIT